MYLGIDFLLGSGRLPYVVEVNVGLPGGAQEYDLTHLVYLGRPSGIFDKIEKTSRRAYGKGFQEYLASLPFIESLKPFKIWMDGQGPFPETLHPGLRLEDKWIQYELLKNLVPMPETKIFNPLDLSGAEKFLKKKRKVVLKRRVGRGGRGFQVIGDPAAWDDMDIGGHPALLQEFIESRVGEFVFSIRSIAFGGEFMCMYANLSSRATSNHGILTFVSDGDRFGLVDRSFKTQSFDQKSWEADLWFGRDEPAYLRHNLYEDEVAQTTLVLPGSLYKSLQALSVKIEKFYDSLDLAELPRACFEDKNFFY
jgi:ATP-grasp domain